MKLSNRFKITSIIPVASMSDIAFLLLIFMLLTSILTPQPPLQIEPPKVPNTAEVKEEKGLRIYLNADKLASVNDDICKLEEINNAISSIADNKQRVFLYAGSDCVFEDVDQVLDALKENKFEQVTFICREDRGGLLND